MQLTSLSLALTRAGLGGFSPAALFLYGEQGVWYEPSLANGTCFQDAAGTTPVTAVEQPVGLMLDKSKGPVLGPELCTDPGFNDPSAWSFGGATPGWSVSGGKAEVTQTAAGSRWVKNGTPLTIGKTYLVRADVTVAAGSCAPDMSAVGAGDATSSGPKQWIVTASTPTLQFIARSTFIGSIDNVSVRELPGNHATQTTSTSRPVLSARYNLLTKTEQFDDAVWSKVSATVTANAAVAPDGTTTADLIARNASGDARVVGQLVGGVVGAAYTLSAYLRQEAARYCVFQVTDGGTSGVYCYLDLQTGVVSQAPAAYGATPPTLATASISPAGNGWFRCSLSFVSQGTIIVPYLKPITYGTGAGFNSGDTIGSSIYIWGASLVPANQASIPYQRVNTATDYDADPAKFKPYLKFDGVDDFLVTNSIDFTSTDKMTVFAGVRKMVDVFGPIAELSDIWTGSNGTFFIAPAATPNACAWGSKGTLQALAVSQTPTAPHTGVWTGIGNISGDQATLRINGAQVAQSTSDQGTGNYGNYPLYIGRRGGTIQPFNGQLYSLIVRGAATSDTQVSQTETWVNGKTGAY